MTDAIQSFPLTIPPNGTVDNIFFVDCELGDSNVTKILLVFPPGCANLVGARIERGGTQVYPLIAGTWFTLEVDPTGMGNSGQWHVAGYNTDIYPHTLQAYFYYDYLDQRALQSASQPISL